MIKYSDKEILEILKEWKCCRCGYNEFTDSLHFHHKDFNKKNNSWNNFVVLCANCHFPLHRDGWNKKEIENATLDPRVNLLFNGYLNPIEKKKLEDLIINKINKVATVKEVI